MSNQIRHGGPAFPAEADGGCGPWAGMTLRDYFAAKAMIPQRLLMLGQKSDGVTREMQLDRITGDAYAIADAMLAARKVDP